MKPLTLQRQQSHYNSFAGSHESVLNPNYLKLVTLNDGDIVTINDVELIISPETKERYIC